MLIFHFIATPGYTDFIVEKREGEIILHINNFSIDQIEIPEKTLVRFEK